MPVDWRELLLELATEAEYLEAFERLYGGRTLVAPNWNRRGTPLTMRIIVDRDCGRHICYTLAERTSVRRLSRTQRETRRTRFSRERARRIRWIEAALREPDEVWESDYQGNYIVLVRTNVERSEAYLVIVRETSDETCVLETAYAVPLPKYHEYRKHRWGARVYPRSPKT